MPATATAAPTRADILNAFRDFICQRPGINPGNYVSGWNDRDGLRAYRQECREITADRTDALALLDAVEWRQSITADDLLDALNGTRRLSWDAGRGTLNYCESQYFPTEYRRAAASALASVLWSYWRDECGHDTADAIRAEARRSFRSRRIIRRFFN